MTNPQSFYCVAAKHPRALSSDALRTNLHSLTLRQKDEQQSSRHIDTKAELMPSYNSIREAVGDAVASCARAAATSHVGAPRQDDHTAKPAVDGIVLVCGTFFIMSEARAALGIIEPRDGDILHDLLTESGTKVGRDAQVEIVDMLLSICISSTIKYLDVIVLH